MRFFISAGEPSGDLHAANLARALRARFPQADFVGLGGPKLAAAGVRVLYPLVELAVMWIGRALLNLHRFIGVALRADRCFRDERPDALILIDFPGFHWWLARLAKRRGIPVIYYVPPQLWAWAGWRVKKVRKYVDHVLCSLEFEPAWYHARGVPQAQYVGHPFFDELRDRTLDGAFLEGLRSRGGPLVAILPGSRTMEITRNLPMMVRAAARLTGEWPGVRFAVACLRPKHAELASRIIAEERLPLPNLEVVTGHTPEVLRVAALSWTVSGSVSLELLSEALPSVIVYRVRRFDMFLKWLLLKVRFITLVNLLADEELMPEYLTPRDCPEELVRWARRWLDDPAARHEASARLVQLRDRVARPGASERAAEIVAEIVSGAGLRADAAHRPMGRAAAAARTGRGRSAGVGG